MIDEPFNMNTHLPKALVNGLVFAVLLGVGVFCHTAFMQHRARLLEVVDQNVWFDVFTDFSPLDTWQARWQEQVEELTRVGGCDCHTAQFSVRATLAAIKDFPNRMMASMIQSSEGPLRSTDNQLRRRR